MDRPKVVKLAQPGFDAGTAGDENLVYNSNWPLLKIYKQGSFTRSDITNSPQVVINHDLGYVPMFWIFHNLDIAFFYNGKLATRSEFTGAIVNFPAATTKSLIYEFVPPDNSLANLKFYYYIFALDITKPYQAPTIKSGGVIGPRNEKTAFKLAKPGKDVSSKRLEDYVVNSDARSPMVHAVYPGTVVADSTITGGQGFTFYHKLGYVPMFFAYLRHSYTSNGLDPNSYLLMTPDGSGTSGFTVDEQKIQVRGNAIGDNISLVILKDPFDINYTVNVTI